MAQSRFLDRDLYWKEIELRVPSARKVLAAIAYLGSGGSDYLPLRAGDVHNESGQDIPHADARGPVSRRNHDFDRVPPTVAKIRLGKQRMRWPQSLSSPHTLYARERHRSFKDGLCRLCRRILPIRMSEPCHL